MTQQRAEQDNIISFNTNTEQQSFSRGVEQSVLGGLILENEKWVDISTILNAGDFHLPQHQILFNAIAKLHEKNSPFDLLTLSEWLHKNNNLNAIGGGGYLGIICSNIPSAANINDYAKIVKRHSLLRQITQLAVNPEKNAEGLQFAIAALTDLEMKIVSNKDLADDLRKLDLPPIRFADVNEALPLQRPIAEGKEFPIAALGDILGNAAIAIQDNVQCDIALVGNSILAGAALVAQGIGNIEIEKGWYFPLNSYHLSLAPTGERKSRVDQLVLQAHKEYEKELIKVGVLQESNNEEKDEGKRVIIETTTERVHTNPARHGHFILDEPTLAGIQHVLFTAQPSIGIYSDEGSQMLGGFSMKNGQMGQTIAALSKMWDGAPISRSRGGEATRKMYNRRCSQHLMIQPEIAKELMLSNKYMEEQGFLARFLMVAPKSTRGKRPLKKMSDVQQSDLATYRRRVTEMLDMVQYNEDGELILRHLTLSPEAVIYWEAFYEDVEPKLAENAEYSDIIGFASKALQHATKLAATLQLFDDPQSTEVSTEYMIKGITLIEYFMSELLRLTGVKNDPLLDDATKLLNWLHGTGKKYFVNGTIKLRPIVQSGPRFVRKSETAHVLMGILEAHSHVTSQTPDRKGAAKFWRLDPSSKPIPIN